MRTSGSLCTVIIPFADVNARLLTHCGGLQSSRCCQARMLSHRHLVSRIFEPETMEN